MIKRSEMAQIIKEGKLTKENAASYLAQICPICYDNNRLLSEEETKHYNPHTGYNKISLLKIVCRHCDWHDASLEDVLKEFRIWFESETREPEEINKDYVEGRLSHWGKVKNSLRRKQKPDTPSIGGDEWFYFQCGTSYHRGQIIPEGLGYVFGECTIWIEGKALDLGLQVSERGNHCRSGYDRLHYYSYNQSIKGLSRPAIVVGKIRKRYVFDENNKGEYFIPKEYFSLIEDFEILDPEDFKKKYLEEA